MKSKVYTGRLGKTQVSFLGSLIEHKGWIGGGRCGWYWDTQSGTIRLCQSLVKKGLVAEIEYEVKTKTATYKTPMWVATPLGKRTYGSLLKQRGRDVS